MNNDDITKKLVELGLNEREAKLYFSLLQIPEGAASDLQRISGVPRTKVYEALERLTNQGFCYERVEGRKRFFRAVPPDEVHNEILQRWEANAQKRLELANEVFTELKDLSKTYEERNQEIDFIEVIRSRVQISRRYVSFLSETEDEVLSFVRPPFAAAGDPEEYKRQDIAENDAMSRGVRNRTIYMVDRDWADFIKENLDRRQTGGEEARLTTDLPFKMFVFDGTKTLIALRSLPGATGSDFSMIAVSDAEFAKAFCILFDVFWEKAYTVDEWPKLMADMDAGEGTG